ncbi:hypothetical protein AB0P21_06495 [Kribbella sp. NPDC056861]|uniref:hypothetical protein n=1 Tax=Kribbella sp. NPDC056861 TaxID=3154857 RepID=UPI003440845C
MTAFGVRLLTAVLLLSLAACDPTPDQAQSTAPTTPVLSQPVPATDGPALAAATGTAGCTDPQGDVKSVDLVSTRITGDGHRLTIVFKLAKALPANGYLTFDAIASGDRSTLYFLSPNRAGQLKQFYWEFDQLPVYVDDVQIVGSTITLVFPAVSLKGLPARWQWQAKVGIAEPGGGKTETDSCPDVTRVIGMNQFPG